ncbi:alpha-amylase [Pediococcus ethanolidurans]|uniref:alpha-amylase family glycosyl hydrolase n=1 Tax=Pediococcus ethanolidurans TaxID=319653 RepID=UPI0021AA1874|nr:alpha-amylase family glycosyl hydrolase [Pediococcus ethanolidurans]MCT4397292.1 alpha-amylase [Pediococcus ethanolidurans]
MARDTNINLRNQLIYCVFVRNHTKEGTFNALIPDLKRIRDLGTDILWLLPVNPIGETNRKGKLGSPYAIQDYRKINPEYGTKEDFRNLIDHCHELGMKVIMDIVYNHTSPDSVLKNEHPDWFLKDKKGDFKNKVIDWSDVSDLDYSQHNLWQYQIDTLKEWVKLVDGFRCDVAPLVPIDFWMEARKQVAKVRPDCVWLAESTGDGFIRNLRSQNYWASTDSELYQAFDITYDYDISDEFHDYIDKKINDFQYAQALNHQDVEYPANYVKMRFLENHDNERAHKLLPNSNDLLNWMMFSLFQKGIGLIYDGEEFGETHTPSLFDKDTIVTSSVLNFSPSIKKMKMIKNNSLCVSGNYKVEAFSNDIVSLTYSKGDKQLVGIFSLNSSNGIAKVTLNDGEYLNLFNNEKIKVRNQIVQTQGTPIILQN